MAEYVLVARRPIPQLGIRVDDRLLIEPGSPYPIIILRPGDPNAGRILLEIEDGNLEPVTGCPALSSLAAALGSQPPPPFPLPPSQFQRSTRVIPFRRRRADTTA